MIRDVTPFDRLPVKGVQADISSKQGGRQMGGSQGQIFLAMVGYMAVVIGIGIYYARRASTSSDYFLIGGRTLGPWVTAMAAEASDMSGWLLMGLPGWPIGVDLAMRSGRRSAC